MFGARRRGTVWAPMDPDSIAPPSVAIRLLDSRLSGWGFPHRGSALAAGLDLHACIDAPLTLAPGDPPVLVPAGFAMRIGDPDWCAMIAPRSGLGHRGLVLGNTIGIVDADYEGECMISAWNRNCRGTGLPDDGVLTIAPGDRIAQLVLVRIGRPRVAIVEAFSEASARGAAGFGSSGIAAPRGGHA